MTSESFCLSFTTLSYLWKHDRERLGSGVQRLRFTFEELGVSPQDLKHLECNKPHFASEINKYYRQFGLEMVIREGTMDVLELSVGSSTL